ncbi:pyridoxamine 5'-phosphate oxidase family protein [Kocuria coralli]|uniref:Pyridoxamine 5'-phosphate oxidase family protein n=1 Tax=Kocuria coralli TaxID=1461025 RepID=A0A5J5L034_9MICC|nr:pyridoxamine 5'-phosphate oxidase family protein [Kocuria coralli]KAA9395304.1 pyridoxamine 5'-phosphate oxidase family protein [Kocuria coralli]
MNSQSRYRELTRDEAWELLEREPFGRLAVVVSGLVDIFPVNFVVHNHKLWFRTAQGSKLASLVVNNQVAFEADRKDEENLEVSSVVVHGRARRIEDGPEFEMAEGLDLRPWVRSFKPYFVVVEPEQVSGRAFPISSAAADEDDE